MSLGLSAAPVCIVNGLDSYSSKGALAFSAAARAAGLAVAYAAEVPENPSPDQVDEAAQHVARERCAVVFCIAQAPAAGAIARAAAQQGALGPRSSRLWLWPDAVTGALDTVMAVARTPATLQSGAEVPAAPGDVLRGSVGSIPMSPSGPLHEQFLRSYGQRASTRSACGGTDVPETAGCPCSAEADSAGSPLFAFDVDGDPGTPRICAGFNSTDEPNIYRCERAPKEGSRRAKQPEDELEAVGGLPFSRLDETPPTADEPRGSWRPAALRYFRARP